MRLSRKKDFMKLSNINDENLSDDDINAIVYSNIFDNGNYSKYCLVFGNSMLLKERVVTVVRAYKSKRFEKIIFMGGVNGVSNQDNSNIAEAIKMKELAIKLGVKEEDILLDTTSNNTFENVDNALELLKNELSTIRNITIITSEFHLKRCYAILKKKLPWIEVTLIPAKDGFTDNNNWFLSDNSWNSGRSLATYEAHLLVKYAKEEKIEDLEVNLVKSKIN